MQHPGKSFAAESSRTPVRLRRTAILALCGLIAVPAVCAAPHRVTGGHGAQQLRGNVNGRPPGYLGIEFHDTPDYLILPPRVGVSRGVEVVRVDHDGPAGKAGLQPHDVILTINAQPIANAETLRRFIHDAGAGGQVVLIVYRTGRTLAVNAHLADRDEVAREAMARLQANDPPKAPPASVAPEGEALGFIASEAEEVSDPPPTIGQQVAPARSPGLISSMLHGSPVHGVVLDTMEPQLASYFGAPQGTGLLVHSVEPGSSGAAAGLRAGDVLLRADAVMLRSSTDWTKHMRGAKGRAVSLLVLRDHREIVVVLEPEPKHHSMVEWPQLF